MIGKFLIRSIGVATCMAVVASGWDAEAGWRRHHCRTSCCYETVCCEPVCCERVVYEPACCETVRTACCRPACETVCCGTVRETVIVPAGSCCDGRIVATAPVSSDIASTAKPAPAQQPTVAGETKAKAAALKR